MKRIVLALTSLSLLACGGGQALQLKSPNSGSVVDRLLAVQESFGVLIGGSSSSDEAANKINAYCAEHADAIARTRADQEAALEDEALRDEFIKRSQALEERTNKAFVGKDHLFEDGQVEAAMAACMGEG